MSRTAPTPAFATATTATAATTASPATAPSGTTSGALAAVFSTTGSGTAENPGGAHAVGDSRTGDTSGIAASTGATGAAIATGAAATTPSNENGAARKPRRGLTITSHVLAALVGLFITYVGVTFFLMPHDTFMGFGVPEAQVPVGEMTALLNVKGGRDIGLGLITFILLATRQTRALGWALIAMSVMPFIDMTVVLSYGGSAAAALGIHGATALYVLLVGAFIAWNERPRKTS